MSQKQIETTADYLRGQHDSVSASSEETAGAGSANTLEMPQFAPPSVPGEIGRLGKYRIQKELGRGGMGAVYLAFDERLQRQIAIKIMLPKAAANATAKDRFLREARAAARISSDHVVNIYEADEIDGTPYIAIQLLQGYPLDAYLKKKGSPSLTQVVRIGREIALGLVAAHKLGLVHRDIKPGNIWLEAPNGRVKLLDFGLAKPVEVAAGAELTASGAVVGTPAYMAPEQGLGIALDGRADLFSLGCVLYRLCTGKLPFERPTLMSILLAVATEEPTPVRDLNPEVSEALAALIRRLMAKNAADRLPTALAVVKEFDNLIDSAKKLANDSKPHAVMPQIIYLPMTVSVQEPSPFADIDTVAESEGSRPVTEAPPKPPRKLPPILVGLMFFAVLVVFAAGFIIIKITNKDGTVTEIKVDEKSKIEIDGKTVTPASKKTAVVNDPDRRAAEYVLSIGGNIIIAENGKERAIPAVGDLPQGTFELTDVVLSYNAKVSDAGLANFKDCKNLTDLNLGQTKVSDAGLANFKDCKNLTVLYLNHTNVSEAGLANFKDCKNFTYLSLFGCKQLSVAGLAQFKDCKNLTHLDIRQTNVTVAGIDELKKTLPQCQIEWDGGTIEPTSPSAAGANLALTLDGNAAWVELPSLNYDGSHPVTLEAWVKLDRTQEEAIVSLAGKTWFTLTAGANNWGAILQDGDRRVGKAVRGSAKIGERVHAAAVYDGKTVRVFLNGRAQEAGDFAPFATWRADAGSAIGVGFNRVAPAPRGAFAKGTVDEVRISKVARYDKDFEPKSRFETDPDTLALYHCDEGQGDVLKDSSGNNHHGKIVGAKWLKADGVPSSDPDRRAAEYVLSIGGTVRVNGREREVKTVAELPREAFQLTSVGLYENKQVSDAGLVHFKDCKNLTYLGLNNTAVSDAGFVNFEECKNLKILDLTQTQVTDVGLIQFKDCKDLTYLGLNDTQVSDAGLAHFKDCKHLSQIHLKKTKVTAAKFEGLKAAFPQCKIESDYGTYVPIVAPAQFMEAHGITLDAFKEWAAKLPKGYQPSWISLRSSGEVRFDAVATLVPNSPEWKLVFVKNDDDKPYYELKSTHRLARIANYKVAGKFDYCALGIFDNQDGQEGSYWIGNSDFVGGKIVNGFKYERERDGLKERWLPYSLVAYNYGDGISYDLMSSWQPDVACEWHPELSAEELAVKIAEYRKKGWRPHIVSVHSNREDVKFLAVFTENKTNETWDFTPNLAVADYEKQLADRKLKGERPRCIGSHLTDNKVSYTVVWDRVPAGK